MSSTPSALQIQQQVLAHDYLPFDWRTYRPTLVEVGVTLGSFGWFFFWFLLFITFLPGVSVAETKAELVFEAEEAPQITLIAGALLGWRGRRKERIPYDVRCSADRIGLWVRGGGDRAERLLRAAGADEVPGGAESGVLAALIGLGTFGLFVATGSPRAQGRGDL